MYGYSSLSAGGLIPACHHLAIQLSMTTKPDFTPSPLRELLTRYLSRPDWELPGAISALISSYKQMPDERAQLADKLLLPVLYSNGTDKGVRPFPEMREKLQQVLQKGDLPL